MIHYLECFIIHFSLKYEMKNKKTSDRVVQEHFIILIFRPETIKKKSLFLRFSVWNVKHMDVMDMNLTSSVVMNIYQWSKGYEFQSEGK